jgi:hypothetical protein
LICFWQTTALEEGLKEPAKIIPFEKKKASGQ